MAKDFEKHPLMQLLGMRLAKDRGARKSEEISKSLECATSTYRLAESGSIGLNPSLGLKLCELYDYEFSAITILLVSIQITNSLESVNMIKSTLKKVGEAEGDRFKIFLQTIEKEFWEIAQRNDEKELHDYIESEKLTEELLNYLKESDYGKKEQEIVSEESEELAKKIKNLPTIYSDFVESFLENIDDLPIKMRFDSLVKWERKNRSVFEKLNAVIENYKAIVNVENLSRYSFEYLWDDSFEEANFIFFNNADKKALRSDQIKKIFSDTFILAIQKDEDEIRKQQKLKDFDKAMVKINIKNCRL